jgi:hypothetical protein
MRALSGLEQKEDRCPSAATAIPRLIAPGLAIPAAFRMRLQCEAMNDLGGGGEHGVGLGKVSISVRA